MKTIKLLRLMVENFKGIKSFILDTKGGDTEIVAENGVGKTTNYDAFFWLFFGKDSTGRKEFELRPLDKNQSHRPIKGVVVSVTAVIDIDGIEHWLKKESHEKIVKKQLRGYETLCWIDEVPKKVSEYQDYIADIISEERFKLLTDLHFFNEKLHWTDRRGVLLEIAGEIGEPEGFNELLAARKNYSIDDYRVVTIKQKVRYAKERDEINPRIDELVRGIEEPGKDTAELQEQRTKLKAEIEGVKTKRQGLLDAESERQQKINRVNQLAVEQNKRAADLRNDPKRTEALQDERTKLQVQMRESSDKARAADAALDRKRTEKESLEDTLKIKQRNLEEVRTEYTQVSERKESTACYTCGQTLPKDKLDEIAKKKDTRLEEISKQGNALKDEINIIKEQIKKVVSEERVLSEELKKAEAEDASFERDAEKCIAEITKEIADLPEPDVAADETWMKYDGEITELKAEIGEPASEQLKAIENKLSDLEAGLQKINETLAQADRIEKDRKRIAELTVREKELSQLIADTDNILDQIERYKIARAELINEAVNDKFQVAEFKMFKEYLNEGIKECCEVTLKTGVPYPDMSFGQQIYVGADITNVLSEYYGVSAPLFIDHSESMTLPIETKAQRILLRAQAGVKQLKVRTLAKVKAVA